MTEKQETEPAADAPAGSEAEKLRLTPSRQFPNWLAEQGVSLAFTTYQAGKLFLIGLNADGRLSIFERTFNRCMGLWTDSQTIWMSSLYQIWRMENVLPAGETYRGHDRLFVPQVGYTTGDIDVHDMAVDRHVMDVDIAGSVADLGHEQPVMAAIGLAGGEHVLHPPDLVERTHPDRLAVRPEPHTAVEGAFEDRQPPVRVEADQKQLSRLIGRERQTDALFGEPVGELSGRRQAELLRLASGRGVGRRLRLLLFRHGGSASAEGRDAVAWAGQARQSGPPSGLPGGPAKKAPGRRTGPGLSSWRFGFPGLLREGARQ